MDRKPKRNANLNLYKSWHLPVLGDGAVVVGGVVGEVLLTHKPLPFSGNFEQLNISGQGIPNSSNTGKHLFLDSSHSVRHGGMGTCKTVQTGAYKEHRNKRKSL